MKTNSHEDTKARRCWLGKVMTVILGSIMLASMTADCQTNTLLPSQEITVWPTSKADCSIRGYDSYISSSSFYPELIVNGTNRALVSFLSGSNYVVRCVQNGSSSAFFDMDSYPRGEWTNGLPQIFTRNNGFVVTRIKLNLTDKHQDRYDLTTIVLDQSGHRIGKEEQLPLVAKKARLGDVLLLDDGRYLIAGVLDEVHFRISPDPRAYQKNCTILYSNGTNTPPQRIESWGLSSATGMTYLATTDQFQCVWLRESDSLIGTAMKPSICFSRCLVDGQWESPRVLSKNDSIRDFSIASTGGRTFVVWTCVNGAYVVEVGKKKATITPMKIGDLHKYRWEINECSSCVDVAGNLYVVWIENQRYERINSHKIVLRACINGQWTQEYTISEGEGQVRSPRIKMDASGNIHLVYLKEISNEMTGCFYRKLPKLGVNKIHAPSTQK